MDRMMRLKDLIELKRFYVILMFALLICIPLPAYADTEDVQDVDVTVDISPMFWIEYTGDPVIYFDIGYEDIVEGSEGQPTDGYITWWSTIEPWHITVHRSDWVITNGGWLTYPSWYLEVKYGPPDNSKWVRIWPAAHTPRSVFAHSGEFVPPTGTGVCEGIDWKVKELYWHNAHPGTYTCTVTFTIVAGSPPE